MEIGFFHPPEGDHERNSGQTEKSISQLCSRHGRGRTTVLRDSLGPHSGFLRTAADPGRAGAQRGPVPALCHRTAKISPLAPWQLVPESSRSCLRLHCSGPALTRRPWALRCRRNAAGRKALPAPLPARPDGRARPRLPARDCGAQQTHGWLGNSKREGALCYCRGGGGRVWGFLPFVFRRFSFPSPPSLFPPCILHGSQPRTPTYGRKNALGGSPPLKGNAREWGEVGELHSSLGPSSPLQNVRLSNGHVGKGAFLPPVQV